MGRRPLPPEERKASKRLRNQRYYATHKKAPQARDDPHVDRDEVLALHTAIHEDLQPITAFVLNNGLGDRLYRSEFDFLKQLLITITASVEPEDEWAIEAEESDEDDVANRLRGGEIPHNDVISHC
jgi:hypothetical protein